MTEIKDVSPQCDSEPIVPDLYGVFIEDSNDHITELNVKFTGELKESVKYQETALDVNGMIIDSIKKEMDSNKIFITDIKSIQIKRCRDVVDKTENNLTLHARRELQLMKNLNTGDDPYGNMINEAVIQLVELFGDQGHSDMSASITRDIFNSLSNFETIVPLTLEDDEWCEIGITDGVPHYQNKRNSAVFKNDDNGAYYINAFYKKTQNNTTWSGNLDLKNGWSLCRCYLREDKPALKKFCINVTENEVSKADETVMEPGSCWWTTYANDLAQIKELSIHYKLELCKDGRTLVCK